MHVPIWLAVVIGVGALVAIFQSIRTIGRKD